MKCFVVNPNSGVDYIIIQIIYYLSNVWIDKNIIQHYIAINHIIYYNKSHNITIRDIILQYVTLYYNKSHYITINHIKLQLITLYYNTPLHGRTNCIMLWLITHYITFVQIIWCYDKSHKCTMKKWLCYHKCHRITTIIMWQLLSCYNKQQNVVTNYIMCCDKTHKVTTYNFVFATIH